MAKKRRVDTPEELVLALAVQGCDRVALFADALRGANQDAIEAALRDDARLRAELRAAIGDVEALAGAPWLVQYAGRLDLREAIPELLAVARAGVRSSEQAAQQLVKFGERRSLVALAADVKKQVGLLQSVCIEALFALGDDLAWKRLHDDVAEGGPTSAATLWYLASEKAIAPRWIDVAVAALKHPESSEAARAVLEKALTPELRRAHFGKSPPAVSGSPPSVAQLAEARAAVEKLLAKLPKFPASKAARRLDELEAIVGRVPALVRALHERVDGLEDVWYDTKMALKEARAWDQKYDPRHSPRELVPAFLWPVAPDGYTKAGLSGGPAYSFELPGLDDDPVLTNAPKKPRYSAFVARALRAAARLNHRR